VVEGDIVVIWGLVKAKAYFEIDYPYLAPSYFDVNRRVPGL